MVNQMYLDKANVLIEALPYIQRFNRKIIVIKYGGSAMVDEELKRNVIQDVVLLKLVGFKPIIVHGGGKEISRWVGKVGMEPKFVNGLRVTDADTMEVAEMVLNKVNKELVTMIQSLGVNAVGISGKDGGLLNVEKKLSKGEDIGFVGNIKNVNPKVLYDLLENDFLPVVCPVGMDDDFNTYNINADDAACAIAEALNAKTGIPDRYRGCLQRSEGSGEPDFRAPRTGSKRSHHKRKCRWRHDSKTAGLHRCDRERRIESPYHGRKNPALPAA